MQFSVWHDDLTVSILAIWKKCKPPAMTTFFTHLCTLSDKAGRQLFWTLTCFDNFFLSIAPVLPTIFHEKTECKSKHPEIYGPHLTDQSQSEICCKLTKFAQVWPGPNTKLTKVGIFYEKCRQIRLKPIKQRHPINLFFTVPVKFLQRCS